jgi:hypothetical protein
MIEMHSAPEMFRTSVIETQVSRKLTLMAKRPGCSLQAETAAG